MDTKFCCPTTLCIRSSTQLTTTDLPRKAGRPWAKAPLVIASVKAVAAAGHRGTAKRPARVRIRDTASILSPHATAFCFCTPSPAILSTADECDELPSSHAPPPRVVMKSEEKTGCYCAAARSTSPRSMASEARRAWHIGADGPNAASSK